MDYRLELIAVPVSDVGITDAEPGSVKGLQLVVDDADEAHADLAGRGVEIVKPS